MLFGILCCQHAFEDLYNFLVKRYQDLDGSDLLRAMCNADAYMAGDNSDEVDETRQEYDILVEAFRDKSDDEIRKMAHFMDLFVQVIDKDGNKSLDKEELEGFGELLGLTTITAAGNDQTTGEDSKRSDYRRWSRSIMTKVASVVNPLYKNLNEVNRINPVYQVNSDESDFKTTWADVWTYMVVMNDWQIDFENALVVNEVTGEVSLRTWTSRRRSFPKDDFLKWTAEGKLLNDEGFEWRDKQKGIIKVSETLGMISGNDDEQQQIADKVIEKIRNYLRCMQLI